MVRRQQEFRILNRSFGDHPRVECHLLDDNGSCAALSCLAAEADGIVIYWMTIGIGRRGVN